MASLRPPLEQTRDLLDAMGAQWVVLLDDCALPTPERGRALDATARNHPVAKVIAAPCSMAERGLKCTVHPHVVSGVETEAEVERLLADTPEALVGLCFDFGHHAYSGADAVAFMQPYADRIPYYHFKNVDPVLLNSRREHRPYHRVLVGRDV